MSRQSSITVGVRVRPFTEEEENKLITRNTHATFYADGQLRHHQEQQELELMRQKPNFIRKIVKVVDDKMLVFDPQETNPYTQVQRRSFPQMSKSARIRDLKFVFDHLFDEKASQMQVFESTTKPLLDSVLEGYNATVFAYGATGCGKTHTISGTLEEPGIIFLTMQELYRKIETLSDARNFDVSISFLEIYNESIRDLLCPETSHNKLNLREDSQQRIVVSNLSVHKPENVEQVMEMIVLGNRNRTCSATEANSTSSRSHAVLQIIVSSTSKSASLSQEHSFATLSVIDLAGSERAAATKNRGERLTEGANINRSLLALGNCINALCAGPPPHSRAAARRPPHVPYRDSKLTRLLKFSLGGNCKTVMIVCVSPSSKHYDETLNTLKYADRAKEIKTKVTRNQANLDRHVGSYLKMITEQKQEITALRARESEIAGDARQRALSDAGACLSAISNDISALRRTIERNTGPIWERVAILAKRKLMLMKLDELRVFSAGLRSGLDQQSSRSNWGRNGPNLDANVPNPNAERAAKAASVLRLAEQISSDLQRDIVALEDAYEAEHELDDVFARCTGFSTQRLQELPAFDSQMAAMHSALVSSVHEGIEKQILVSSSVLFDHMISELDEFKGHCSQDNLTRAADTLQRMQAFSAAVDAGVAAYVKRMQDQGSFMPDAAKGGEKKDKRSSTSPLQATAHKRRGPLVERDSFDETPKSDFEDDTTSFDHVNHSVLDGDDDLTLSPVLQSPPTKDGSDFGGVRTGKRYVSASNEGHSRFGNGVGEDPASEDDSLLRHPLLNKRASKVMSRD